MLTVLIGSTPCPFYAVRRDDDGGGGGGGGGGGIFKLPAVVTSQSVSSGGP